MKRVAGYIRVSTLEQSKEGISLANQKYKIESYAAVKDLSLVKIISEEGKSGKNLHRPGIQELIEMAEKKMIDAVVVYKLDRLTRSTKDLLFLIEDIFNKYNVAFYSVNESIDTTSAQGKFFLTIMGAMAQMERDLISERTVDALQELKRMNRRLGSPDMIPFGMQLLNRLKAYDKDLIPDPKLFHIVKDIYRLRNNRNQTLEQIGKKHGIAKSSIKYILDNRIYQEFL